MPYLGVCFKPYRDLVSLHRKAAIAIKNIMDVILVTREKVQKNQDQLFV